MLNEAEWNEQEKAFENAIICNQCYMKEKCKKPGDKATCELYKHPEHHNCKGTAVPVLREYDYTKIQNYIEAIRLIAEKVGTAETDCIEQLARDVGNYLYDIMEGEKR